MNPAGLLPHTGAMCLLDDVTAWDHSRILCTTRSHLSPDNPLRRGGRLGIVCAAEYGMQAAAVHGALRSGGQAPPGFAAALRSVRFGTDRLDDPAHGVLSVLAEVEHWTPAGSVYRLVVSSDFGRELLSGRATIATPPP